MDDKHMNLEAMHRIRTVMNVAQGNALTSFVRNNQTKEGGANGRTASLDTPLIPVTMTTAEKISAILQKNRLDLVQTQKSLALASMSAVDPSTILDAKRFSKHPQGLTHVKRQQTDIAQKAGAVVRTALPPATLLFGAGERFGMGDKATVAVREGVTDLLAQRERHKDLLVLLEEQGGAIGDGKGMDRRGLIGLSQVSGLEVLPGLQQQQQQGKTSTMMKMDDDDIGLGLGLGGVNAGGQGLSYSPPLALDPVARELRLLDKKAHTALKVGDPPARAAVCSSITHTTATLQHSPFLPPSYPLLTLLPPS